MLSLLTKYGVSLKVLAIAGLVYIVLLQYPCESVLPYDVDIPDHFPEITFPEDNQLSTDRVALGKQLFFDPNLSIDSTISCSSCHHPFLAFADSVDLSNGVNGGHPQRNSPSLLNVAYLPAINKDGGVTKLDLQAMVPIEDEHEMGISILALSTRLKKDPAYLNLFKRAYDRDPDAYSISRALGSYVRTLLSGSSPYDNYLAGDTMALSTDAKKGMNLFFSERLGCGNCHSGIFLTDHSYQNNGYKLDYGEDPGRKLVTGKESDTGKYRVASLRNVAITAPYMHDGGIKHLSEVIDAYASGQQDHPNRSPFIQPFVLYGQEKEQLLSFLESLTD